MSNRKEVNIEEICKRFKKARKALGMTQLELSAILKIHVRNLQVYENKGTVEPGCGVIVNFMKLGIDATWLLSGEGKMLRTDIPPEHNPLVILRFRQFLSAVIDVSSAYDVLFTCK
jgi:transcriptional regulator with XRE-family HTH domain